MPHQKVEDCKRILGLKLKEYIDTHDHWHKKGYLCPHEGNPQAHATMDEIMDDVKQAHDMLEAAMCLAGMTKDEMHKMDHPVALKKPLS